MPLCDRDLPHVNCDNVTDEDFSNGQSSAPLGLVVLVRRSREAVKDEFRNRHLRTNDRRYI
jgi:hypothetical protein